MIVNHRLLVYAYVSLGNDRLIRFAYKYIRDHIIFDFVQIHATITFMSNNAFWEVVNGTVLLSDAVVKHDVSTQGSSSAVIDVFQSIYIQQSL